MEKIIYQKQNAHWIETLTPLKHVNIYTENNKKN